MVVMLYFFSVVERTIKFSTFYWRKYTIVTHFGSILNKKG